MKRLLKAGLVLALMATTGGCVDLNEKLVSNLGAPYLATPQGLTDGVNSMYAGLRGFYGRGETDYVLTQLGTDTWNAADQVSAGGAQPYIYYDTYDVNYTSLGSFLNALWGWGYTQINRANTVLDQGGSVQVGGSITQAIKDSRLGEAHFMRALAYFVLTQQWGDLTVNLAAAQGVSTEATRESEDSVYKVIISDLTTAISLLPATQGDVGRATKGAAQNLLAKVYLTRAYKAYGQGQADFQQALNLANTVIQSGQYSLVPNFLDLWCAPHRAAAPPDPGGQSFCDLTSYSMQNPEQIFVTTYSYDPTQWQNSNYDHVEYLNHYDGNSNWAAGLSRDLDNGRPFRRLRPSPYLLSLYQQTMWAGTPGASDELDMRFDDSFQTVWFANANGTNVNGTCPYCTNGQAVQGTMLRDASGSPIGAAAGSDTTLRYLMYQVPDSYRQSKAYRTGTPCTTAPGELCRLVNPLSDNNDAAGAFGYEHFPTLKKFQDNLRIGGYFSGDGGRWFTVMRLGETYLIAAEAALGVGDKQTAANDINVLRNRAACKGPPHCQVSHANDPALMVSPSDITLDFIFDELAREKAGEYTRWMDLKRPGPTFFLNRIRTWNPYARPNIQDKHYLRPVPQQEINGVTGPEPYPQNTGWE